MVAAADTGEPLALTAQPKRRLRSAADSKAVLCKSAHLHGDCEAAETIAEVHGFDVRQMAMRLHVEQVSRSRAIAITTTLT